MAEARDRRYKFVEDSVKGWEALLARVYPPNVGLSLGGVADVVPLVDKYGIDWLKTEIADVCKQVPCAGRTASLVDTLVRADLTEVLDDWLADINWVSSLQREGPLIDELQTVEACRYLLKSVLKLAGSGIYAAAWRKHVVFATAAPGARTPAWNATVQTSGSARSTTRRKRAAPLWDVALHASVAPVQLPRHCSKARGLLVASRGPAIAATAALGSRRAAEV